MERDLIADADVRSEVVDSDLQNKRYKNITSFLSSKQGINVQWNLLFANYIQDQLNEVEADYKRVTEENIVWYIFNSIELFPDLKFKLTYVASKLFEDVYSYKNLFESIFKYKRGQVSILDLNECFVLAMLIGIWSPSTYLLNDLSQSVVRFLLYFLHVTRDMVQGWQIKPELITNKYYTKAPFYKICRKLFYAERKCREIYPFMAPLIDECKQAIASVDMILYHAHRDKYKAMVLNGIGKKKNGEPVNPASCSML